MDRTWKSLANPFAVRDKFSEFGEMISEELKCLSPRQQIHSKKLMYDALYMVALKKCNDEKHSYEILDGIVKIDVKNKKKTIKYEKKPESITSEWNENITISNMYYLKAQEVKNMIK